MAASNPSRSKVSGARLRARSRVWPIASLTRRVTVSAWAASGTWPLWRRWAIDSLSSAIPVKTWPSPSCKSCPMRQARPDGDHTQRVSSSAGTSPTEAIGHTRDLARNLAPLTLGNDPVLAADALRLYHIAQKASESRQPRSENQSLIIR